MDTVNGVYASPRKLIPCGVWLDIENLSRDYTPAGTINPALPPHEIAKTIKGLLRSRAFGPLVFRAFAVWSDYDLALYNSRQEIDRLGYEVRDVRSKRSNNNTDLFMTADIAATCTRLRHQLEWCVIGSGDGDMEAAVLAAKEVGLKVMIISYWDKTSSILLPLADSIVSLRRIKTASEKTAVVCA